MDFRASGSSNLSRDELSSRFSDFNATRAAIYRSCLPFPYTIRTRTEGAAWPTGFMANLRQIFLQENRHFTAARSNGIFF